jgi:hypothetical protein
MLFVICVCVVLAVASQIPALRRITFIGAVTINVSHKAFVFCVLFSFVLWYRNRSNILWLGMFVGIFLAACVLAILMSGGRRLLLSVLAIPVFVVYCYHARHWRPTKSMVVIAVGVFVLFNLNLMYSSIRHFDRKGERQERSAKNVIANIEKLKGTHWFDAFASNALFHFSQQAVHYSLITDRFISMGVLDPKPFNTFKFLATYPIPRRIWQEKPKPLGGQIGVEVIPNFARNQGIRWGCGVAGQAVYEGGLLLVPLFAYLGLLLVRFVDEPLKLDPTNPFLIGVLASSSTHFLGWPRGDLGVMSIEIIECFLFAYILGFACRMIYGTERVRESAYVMPKAPPYARSYSPRTIAPTRIVR